MDHELLVQLQLIVERLGDIQGRMATKEELRALEARMATKEDLQALEDRMTTKMADLEGRMTAKMADLEGRMTAKMANLEGRMATKEELRELETRIMVTLENDVSRRISSLFDGYQMAMEKQYELERRVARLENAG